MEYELELDKAVEKIKKENAKTVLIQLPDGLKSKASEIVSYLEKHTNAKIFVWLESNWGNCDYPIIEWIDLLIQFGHSPLEDIMPQPSKW